MQEVRVLHQQPNNRGRAPEQLPQSLGESPMDTLTLIVGGVMFVGLLLIVLSQLPEG